MDCATKLSNQKEIERYLEEKKIYDIFEDCMKSLIINQPANATEYLIKKLSEPDQKRICIVGPPGSSVREFVLQLSGHFGYECLSAGDLLKKEINKKQEIGEIIESSINNYQYVKDEIVIEIIKKGLEEYEKENKGYILEGFPKTRVQGLALQKMGIIPNSFIILNYDDNQINKCCNKKINESDVYQHIQKEEKKSYAQEHALEYKMNLQGVKEIYQNNYFQVDGSLTEEQMLEDMARILKFKLKNSAPKRSGRVLILGPPLSGRTTLSKNLSKKYGFVSVNTTELLTDQIYKETEIGKDMTRVFEKNDLINDEIVNSLVSSRLSQQDCSMQGYALDGFPKTINQLQSMEDLKIFPSLIIVLECSDKILYDRLDDKRNQPINPITGKSYDTTDKSKKSPGEIKMNVNKRNQRWKELLREVEQQYSDIILKVSTECPPLNVLEKVSFYLENSN